MIPNNDDKVEAAQKSASKWQRECQALVTKLDVELDRNERLTDALEQQISYARSLERQVENRKDTFRFAHPDLTGASLETPRFWQHKDTSKNDLEALDRLHNLDMPPLLSQVDADLSSLGASSTKFGMQDNPISVNPSKLISSDISQHVHVSEQSDAHANDGITGSHVAATPAPNVALKEAHVEISDSIKPETDVKADLQVVSKHAAAEEQPLTALENDPIFQKYMKIVQKRHISNDTGSISKSNAVTSVDVAPSQFADPQVAMKSNESEKASNTFGLGSTDSGR